MASSDHVEPCTYQLQKQCNLVTILEQHLNYNYFSTFNYSKYLLICVSHAKLTDYTTTESLR